MKKTFRKVLVSVMAAVMLLTAAPLSGIADFDWGSLFAAKASAEGTKFKCGENVYYDFDGGTLSIGGEGAMYDYDNWKHYSPFYNLKVNSVEIGLGVTYIGVYAFYNCTGFTSITLPGSVTSIGDNAFYGCSTLASITLPDSVTSIGISAFRDTAYYDESSNWKDNMLYINNCLIEANSNNIESYSIKPGTKCISDGAFAYTHLTDVTIPDSVVSIGRYAFEFCDMEDIVIPNSVITIGDYAFQDCFYLTDITIPDSVISIGSQAFFHCGAMQNAVIGKGVKSIGFLAFYYCSKLKKITVSGSNEYYSSDSHGVLFNKNKTELICYPREKTDLRYIIPDGVMYIDYAAFSQCTIASVVIPSSVISVDTYAFSSCNNLKNVFYAGTQEQWNEISIKSDNPPLTGWADIHGITVEGKCGDGVNYIFDGRTGVLKISGTGSMDNCTSSVNAPWYSLNTCIEKVVISGGVANIGSYAFDGCIHLTDITIGNSVKSIGERAFNKCNKLESIALPNSVLSIGDYAFSDLTELKNINIPNNLTSIGNYAFNGCKGLTDISLPAGLTNLGERSFRNCTSLQKIIIPKGITEISISAFSGCAGLKSLTLPRSVTDIDTSAFSNCYNLKDVYYFGTQEQWNAITVASDNNYIKTAAKHCIALDNVSSSDNPDLKIDMNNRIIYGLSYGAEILGIPSEASGNCVCETVKSGSVIGTGSKMIIYGKDDSVIVDFDIVVFGDVNGDGVYDGMDSVIVNCLANGMLTKEQVGEAVYMAADCNHDGVINEADTALLEQAGIALDSVSQNPS